MTEDQVVIEIENAYGLTFEPRWVSISNYASHGYREVFIGSMYAGRIDVERDRFIADSRNWGGALTILAATLATQSGRNSV